MGSFAAGRLEGELGGSGEGFRGFGLWGRWASFVMGGVESQHERRIFGTRIRAGQSADSQHTTRSSVNVGLLVRAEDAAPTRRNARIAW